MITQLLRAFFSKVMEVNSWGVKEVETFAVDIDEAVAWDYMTL